MVLEKKLKGVVTLESNRSLKFRGRLYDKTEFELSVDQFDVQLNENFLPSKTTVSGFLFVVQEAQQNSICYITLPKPCLPYGRHITVNSLELMDRNVSIESFNRSEKPK